MRILVTGADGFAGTHLLAELSRTGTHQITAGAYGSVGRETDESGVRWVSLDVTSQESTRAVIAESGPELVYHLAGQASVGESFRSPQQTWEVNATGTLCVLEALRQEGLSTSRLLLTSSAEVYGDAAEQPVPEPTPLRPLTPYGASKAAAEMIGAQFARAGMVEVVIARSFNQIGPGQDERFVLPSLARQLVRILRGAEEPELHVGNLDVQRDFLDVRDGVRGYVAIMERGQSGEAYNVCSGEGRPLQEVVSRLVELSGTGARIVVDAARVRAVDIPMLEGDPTRLRSLGWSRTVPLAQTLEDLLADAKARTPIDG
ncbi:MAG: GDP-mannose 4,6-dehydratase [Gemmatimonadetes bacterium]|nr:GDP-mannose 4,6-dehydratase [Gemmatimonadota bacterium]